MAQIADAPWIREAEMYGMPPYEDDDIDLYPAIHKIEDALELMLKVDSKLDHAAGLAEQTDFENEIDGLNRKLDEIDQELRSLIQRMREY